MSSHRQSLDAAQQQPWLIIRLRQEWRKRRSDMEFAAIQLFAAVTLWILHTLQGSRP
jgi:hypothetical protein